MAASVIKMGWTTLRKVVLAIFLLVFLAVQGEGRGPHAPLPKDYRHTRSGAYTYSVPGQTLIGSGQSHTVRAGESLFEIARFYGLGIHELRAANPGVDPLAPDEGTKLRIPTAWILPQTRHEGIVINLAEMRLYYFFRAAGMRMVKTFPIGIGREGFSTPTGVYSIKDKIKDPVWYPPRSARLEDASLAGAVRPGPDNPLGGFWLQLSEPGYGIHGTNKPWGIGQRVSRGCIRLYPEDMAWLFESAGLKARVQIVNQPVKFGFRDRQLFVQVRSDGVEVSDLYPRALGVLKKFDPAVKIDRPALKRALSQGHGMPLLISG